MLSRPAAAWLAVITIPALLIAQGQYPSSNAYPSATQSGGYPAPPPQTVAYPHPHQFGQPDQYPPPPRESISVPPVMRVCASPRSPNICSTWIWKGSYYKAWHEDGAHAKVTIGSFSRESVVLNRADTGTPGPRHPGAGFWQVYSGTIASDGHSILDGVSHASDGSSGHFRAYWGSAMALHPQLTVQQWTAPASYPAKSCDPASFDGNGVEAAVRGSQALESRNFPVAACWLRIGAEQENADAEGMLAALLYKGLTGPPDYRSAFTYATLAAEQDNYMGAEVLALIYGKGVGGIKKDPNQEIFWKVSVTQDKQEAKLGEAYLAQLHIQDAQQAQLRKRQQNQAAMGILLLLGLSALGDSGGDSGRSNADDVLQNQRRFNNNACGAGDASACAQVGKPARNNQ